MRLGAAPGVQVHLALALGVTRPVGGTALAGVPADAMPYVEAVKVVAEKFPGRDAVAASTLFMDWDPAYNGLAATVTKVCS